MVDNGRRWGTVILDILRTSMLTCSVQIRGHASKMLGRGNQTLEDILATLRVYRDHVDDEPRSEEAEITMTQRDILQGLIDALQG